MSTNTMMTTAPNIMITNATIIQMLKDYSKTPQGLVQEIFKIFDKKSSLITQMTV